MLLSVRVRNVSTGDWFLELVERMLDEDVRRNIITYTAVISACEKGEQWRHALELFARMQSGSVQRTSITYSAVSSA